MVIVSFFYQCLCNPIGNETGVLPKFSSADQKLVNAVYYDVKATLDITMVI